MSAKPQAFAWNDDPNDVTGFYDKNQMDQYIEALESKWKYWRQSRSDLLDRCKELEARLASAEELLEVPSRKMVYLCRDYKDDKESRNWLVNLAAYCSTNGINLRRIT